MINPAPECVPEVFPNTTEWDPTTSTEKGNVTFYSVMQTFLTLSVSNDVAVNLSPSNPTETDMNVVSVATNSSDGYILTIQAGCACDDAGDFAAGTCSSDNRLKRMFSPVDYISATSEGVLAIDSWGYQFNVNSAGSSSWSPVPTTETILKTTNVANPDHGPLSAGTPDDYNVFYGVRISPAWVVGTYRGTVVWTVVSNV